MINRLALIGTGLIGASLSLALKHSQCVKHVVGYSRNQTNLKKGIELGILNSYEMELENVIKGSDVVVIAVPLGAMESIFKQIAPFLEAKTVLTDVGSAKTTVVKMATQFLGHQVNQFVPGHPIAGTENSGIESGFKELFNHRKIILTPSSNTNELALNTITEMWSNCGAMVEQMSVEHHDEIFAATSHLPHMLAYSLVNCLAKKEDKVEIFKYASGGFRDISRTASSDPTMWRDISIQNKSQLASMMKQYAKEIAELSELIEQSDEEALFDYFLRAKSRRDDLIGHC